MRTRRVAGASLGALAAALALPAVASAHGLVGKQDLPIPRWLFAWAAGIVLVASFVGLSALWRTPRFETMKERRVVGIPRIVEVLGGLAGIAFFGACVYAGFAGDQEATTNLMPTVFYVIFWVGIPFLSVLLGDVFSFVNPWRAVGRGVGWATGRLLRGEAPEPLPYPRWLGRWPAVLGILGFAWLELCYSNKDDPSQLATIALVYAAIQLVGMALFGVAEWSAKGDAFGSYFNLFARLAPLRWGDGALWRRPPLGGIVGLEAATGTVALVCVGIGTTSFDGFSNGAIWNGSGSFKGLGPALQDFFGNLGLSTGDAIEAAFTVGMLMMVAIISGLYLLGIKGMSSVDRGRHPAVLLARSFAHSLVPIALAYIVAHYFSLLAYQGQAMGYLVSDPLGHGADLFGTAHKTIDYGIVSATQVWYVQVAALIVGHVGGLVLAHDRALVEYGDVRLASRSQRWMLAVMVTFTSLALYLLSAAA